jgi:hypothetical protein
MVLSTAIGSEKRQHVCFRHLAKGWGDCLSAETVPAALLDDLVRMLSPGNQRPLIVPIAQIVVYDLRKLAGVCGMERYGASASRPHEASLILEAFLNVDLAMHECLSGDNLIDMNRL